DPQPLVLGLLARGAALTQPDADVDARVAQVQRVRVTLAAVPDHRHLLGCDEGQVGVVVVEQLGHGSISFVLAVACGGAVWGQAEREIRSRARSVMERLPRAMATAPDCT